MQNNLIFYYSKNNRYSINAILSALEQKEIINKLKIFLVSKENDLIKISNELLNPIIVFSFFTPQIWEIKEIISKINKKAVLIAGGPHPTGEPEDTLKMGFNYVLLGEGEITFPKYIEGIILNKELNKIGKNKEYVNLNDFFPFPRKTIKKFGAIEITRGCPFACNFCQTSRIFGKKVRHRSIEKIVEIVEYMKNNNRTDIRFITPNAFSYGSIDGKIVNLEMIELLLKEIKKVLKENGRIFFGSFPSEVRPEHVNEDILAKIKPFISNKNLIIGAQSGSEKILKKANRSHTVSDVYNAVKVAKKFGFIPNVDFIFGLPQEDTSDIDDTIKVMKDLIKMGARIHAHTFMPLPQTPFKYEKPGKIPKKILNIFKHEIPKGVIFGNYVNQEKIAMRIYNYFRSRKEREDEN